MVITGLNGINDNRLGTLDLFFSQKDIQIQTMSGNRIYKKTLKIGRVNYERNCSLSY
jgi:hypothetical protein